MVDALAGWDLPEERSGREAPADIKAKRIELNTFLRTIQMPDPAPRVGWIDVAGVHCLEATPASPTGTLIHAHGGGFCYGQPESWVGLATRLASLSGLQVVVPDYRLAPEHPFPCGLRDIAAVYQHFALDETVPLFGSGDSAGGGLICSVILAARNAGFRLPAGAVLFSPWLDLTAVSRTYDTIQITGRPLTRELMQSLAAHYLQGHAPDDPAASPLFANLKGFPRTLIFASTAEPLVSDAIGFARETAFAGGGVEVQIVPEMPHVWPLMAPHLPESSTTVQKAGAFFRSLAG